MATPDIHDGYESAFAREVAGTKRRFPAQDVIAALCEMLVTTCKVYATSDSDSFVAELEAAMEAKEHLFPSLAADDGPDVVAEIAKAERWVQRFQTQHGQRFVKRFFGSARADRFKAAFNEDVETMTPGIMKALPHFMEVAYAVDLCCSRVVDGDELPETPALFALSRIGLFLEPSNTGERTFNVTFTPSNHAAELAHLATQMQAQTSANALATLESIETPLIRKLRGAYDAMEASEDGVSQAANSIIELIDRLLRCAFTDDEVLAWISAYERPRKGVPLTYPKDGQERPTKQARAMCLISVGGDPGDLYDLHFTVAETVVGARRVLETYKHADTPEDAPDDLLDAVHLVEAALVLIFRLGWLGTDGDHRAEVLKRLRAA